MDSFFEKVTLYDFIGYTIPGCFFWGITGVFGFSDFVANMDADVLTVYSDYTLYLCLAFLAFGYVSGILYS